MPNVRGWRVLTGLGAFLFAAGALSAVGQAAPATTDMILLFNDGQHVEVNRNFESPLGVTVVDAADQPVAGVQVVLQVESGSATFLYIRDGAITDGTTASAVTDVNGSILAIATAGAQPGPVVISVTATADPSTSPQFGGASASFSLLVDPPSFPEGTMPETGTTSTTSISLLALASLVAGLIIVTCVGRRTRV